MQIRWNFLHGGAVELMQYKRIRTYDYTSGKNAGAEFMS